MPLDTERYFHQLHDHTVRGPDQLAYPELLREVPVVTFGNSAYLEDMVDLLFEEEEGGSGRL